MHKHRWFLTFALLLFQVTAWAGSYDAEYLDNYDADSLTLRIAVWPGQTWQGNVRVYGVDGPERAWRADCERERLLAEDARLYVQDMLQGADQIRVTINETDKFGRPLAVVFVDGVSLAQSLIDAGLGREYYGGSRMGWCG